MSQRDYISWSVIRGHVVSWRLVPTISSYSDALGAEHTSTLNTVNSLGILYMDQGKLALAVQMYERALRGYETALGEVDLAKNN